jgi:hypothetical protein
MRPICTSLSERRLDQLRLQCSEQYEERSLFADSILRPKCNECKCKYQSSKEVKPAAPYGKQGRQNSDKGKHLGLCKNRSPRSNLASTSHPFAATSFISAYVHSLFRDYIPPLLRMSYPLT